MTRYGHHTHVYDHRRVIIRGKDGVSTDVAALEKMVRDDYAEIWRDHIEDLEDLASDIQNNAQLLVPLDMGALRDSIMVRVSRSNRWPGIIAHASAYNKGEDYALPQEENEKYSHEGIRSAHYLGGSFALFLSYYFEDMGSTLELPEELEHAKEYIE